MQNSGREIRDAAVSDECVSCEGSPIVSRETITCNQPANPAWLARFPHRATHWQLRSHILTFGKRPLVMGILNATPDSFSDGGQFFAPQAAVDRALQMVAEGADILDIGGESTRPGSETISAAEELRRVMPVISALKSHVLQPISIDTSKAEVAREAMAAGAEIINDVTALGGDPDMLQVAIESQAGVCAMHMRGSPRTMQDNPTYDDVVGEILAYLRSRRDALIATGVTQNRIALDPGIGFGKTHQHNLTLLAHCRRFHEFGCPLLLGPSRKGFIAKLLGEKTIDRTAGTVGVCLSLASQGVQILRVHDIAAVRQALVLYEASGGIDGEPATLEV
jgi:dihydropteroate synthase